MCLNPICAAHVDGIAFWLEEIRVRHFLHSANSSKHSAWTQMRFFSDRRQHITFPTCIGSLQLLQEDEYFENIDFA